jgi:DNA-binding NarL/FixJ family response regulator
VNGAWRAMARIDPRVVDVSPEQLIAAVRLVAAGDALLAPSITRRLVERFARPARAATPVATAELASLMPREHQVLLLLGRGLSNSEMAEQLVVSEATVKTDVAPVLDKLNLRDRVQAVVLACETGLVSPGRSVAPSWAT